MYTCLPGSKTNPARSWPLLPQTLASKECLDGIWWCLKLLPIVRATNRTTKYTKCARDEQGIPHDHTLLRQRYTQRSTLMSTVDTDIHKITQTVPLDVWNKTYPKDQNMSRPVKKIVDLLKVRRKKKKKMMMMRQFSSSF